MKRLLIILLIVLGIILVLGAYILNRDKNISMTADPLSGSPVPTNPIDNPTPTITPAPVPNDWISYSSAEYGFMIKTPADVNHDTTSEGERFYKLGPSQSTGSELYDGISVIIRSGDLGGDDFKEFVDKKYAEKKNDPVQARVGEMTEVTVAGKSGYAFTVSTLGERTTIYLPKGDAAYIEIMNGTVEPNNRKEFRNTVDTMLNSLIYE